MTERPHDAVVVMRVTGAPPDVTPVSSQKSEAQPLVRRNAPRLPWRHHTARVLASQASPLRVTRYDKVLAFHA